ncbi:hypothetical protein KIH39_08840 [Telmatocola sphagniphila]|uniref:Uncharacterized protein n=1 Tax=Telmatocola sphagniphila TaxID=1123043 RepID=A0A8E6EUR0_9BACT|nr:hypothetical protein [Telmatocola sphagniphila]QVL33994.1 hypothetical protein KIH39_08840 [Telmatocola sphagniphila]
MDSPNLCPRQTNDREANVTEDFLTQEILCTVSIPPNGHPNNDSSGSLTTSPKA